MSDYARAVDTGDWDLYRSLFTEDAHIDYTSAPFGIEGTVDEAVSWLSRNLAVLPMSMHYVTNVVAEVNGDTASVTVQFYNPMRLPGMADLSVFGGYYHHDLVRTGAGWRSAALREQNVWSVNPPVP